MQQLHRSDASCLLRTVGAQHAQHASPTRPPCPQCPAPVLIAHRSNQLGQLTAEGINPPGFFPDQNGSAVSTTGSLVAGGKLYVQLAAGGYHTCGRTAPGAGGETFCWGSNEKYQTGNSFTSSRAAMLPVKVGTCCGSWCTVAAMWFEAFSHAPVCVCPRTCLFINVSLPRRSTTGTGSSRN